MRARNGGRGFEMAVGDRRFKSAKMLTMPPLKPVGHQSTNWMVRLVLMVATAALTSLGTTSPRYIRHTAMYLPWRGSTLQSIDAGSKAELVISATESCSW